MSRIRVTAAALGLAAAATTLPIVTAGAASADVPSAWTKKTSICQTVSFYGENPAVNSNLTPTHVLGGHKRFYYTSGDIQKGWMPVYSSGQDDWHTGWVEASCMADGWDFPDDGTVIR